MTSVISFMNSIIGSCALPVSYVNEVMKMYLKILLTLSVRVANLCAADCKQSGFENNLLIVKLTVY